MQKFCKIIEKVIQIKYLKILNSYVFFMNHLSVHFYSIKSPILNISTFIIHNDYFCNLILLYLYVFIYQF